MIEFDQLVALVARARIGDREAFGSVVTATEPWIVARLLRLGLSREDVEDVAAEAYFAAWRDLRNLDQPNRFRGWFDRLARRLGLLRHEQNRQLATRLEEFVARLLPDANDADAAAAATEGAMATADELLSLLPPQERRIVILRHLEGLSVKEIAGVLHVPMHRVEQLMDRSRKILRLHYPGLVEPKNAQDDETREVSGDA